MIFFYLMDYDMVGERDALHWLAVRVDDVLLALVVEEFLLAVVRLVADLAFANHLGV